MRVEECRVGQVVSFGRPNGEKTLGEIVKVNRKSIKVKQLETRGSQRIRSAGTIWRVAPSLVALVENGKTAETPKAARTEREIMGDISGVFCRLSPENLHCDGEISFAQARRKAGFLNRQLKDLFRELGREVGEGECWRWLRANEGVA